MKRVYDLVVSKLRSRSIVPGLVCLRLSRGNDEMTKATRKANKIFWMKVLNHNFTLPTLTRKIKKIQPKWIQSKEVKNEAA